MTLFDLVREVGGTRRIRRVKPTPEIRQVLRIARERMNDEGAHWTQNGEWVTIAELPSTSEIDEVEQIEDEPRRWLFQDVAEIDGMCYMGGLERAAWEVLGKPDMRKKSNVIRQRKLVLDATVWASQFIEIDDDKYEYLERSLALAIRRNESPREVIERGSYNWNDELASWEDVDAVLRKAANA